MKWSAFFSLFLVGSSAFITSCGDDEAKKVVVSKWIAFPTHASIGAGFSTLDSTYVLKIANGADLSDYSKYAEDYWVNAITYSLKIDPDSSASSVTKISVSVSYFDSLSESQLLKLTSVSFADIQDKPLTLSASALKVISGIVARDGSLKIHLISEVDNSPATFSFILNLDTSVKANFDSKI